MQAMLKVPAWLRDCLFALIAGQAAALSFPPSPSPYGMLLGLVAITFYLDARSPARVFGIGWLFGISWHFGALNWISQAFLVPMPGMGAASLLPVLALAGAFALYIALAFYLWRRFWPGSNTPSVAARLGLAGVLSISEYAYGHLFTGFAWDLTALAFVETSLINTGSIFGAYGVGLLALAGAITASGALRQWIAQRNLPKREAALAAGCIALLAAGFLYKQSQSKAATPEADAMTVRIVQGNTPQRIKWRPENRGIIFNRHVALSSKDGVPKPDLIVWPETATPFNVAESKKALEVIGGLPAKNGFAIIGTPIRTPNADRGYDYANGLLAIDSKGQITARYDKTHLVPFGEFMPLAAYLPFDKLVPGRGSFLAGPGPATMQLGSLPSFSPLICYEVIFPGSVTASERPAFLLNITNDAWYGQSAGPHQHLAISRMRAIEEGLPLIRVANTGISAAFDANGVEIARIPLEQAASIDVKLPPPNPPTLYAQYGDTLYGLLLVFSLALAFFFRRREQSA